MLQSDAITDNIKTPWGKHLPNWDKLVVSYPATVSQVFLLKLLSKKKRTFKKVI